MHKVFEVDEVCPDCKGTGVYISYAESDGAAIVCQKCDGTGCRHYTHKYEEFVGRRVHPDAIRVFQTNPGIRIGGDGNTFGGMPYTNWQKGEPFPAGSEARELVCPAWWYQSADPDRKPHWRECGGGAFSRCCYFPEKQYCWQRWDKEFGKEVTP